MYRTCCFLRQSVFVGTILTTFAAHAGSFVYTALVPPNSTSPAYLGGIYHDEAIGWGGGGGSFVWSQGNYTVVSALQSLESVSDNGVVIGRTAASRYAYSTYNLATGTIQTPALNLPAGEYLDYLGGINASGTVTALAAIDERHGRQHFQPFVQDINGTITLLHNVSKHPYGSVGISDAGVVAMSQFYRNAIYNNGKFKLYQPPPNSKYFQIFFMNGAGVFGGGYYETSSGLGVGYTTKGGPLTVYTQPGWNNVGVSGTGRSGEVVGSYTDSSDIWHGFIYRNGTYTTIDYPGSKGTTLAGVSDDGSIIGYYATSISNDGMLPDLPFIAVCAGGGDCVP